MLRRAAAQLLLRRPSSGIAAAGADASDTERQVLRDLRSRVRASGPLTVAQYMQHVLLHPVTGYYMQRDVFGQRGDFTTSPEISQIFGELIGVWLVHEWLAQDQPADFQLVELGPGRATLLADVLRVARRFPEFAAALSLHLVEVSPGLAAVQERTLRCGVKGAAAELPPPAPIVLGQEACYLRTECLGGGVHASWYRQLEDVPAAVDGARTCFVAHELLDALPVHKFQRDARGHWRELMVDACADSAGLRFVLAREGTPALHSYLPLVAKKARLDPARRHLEVCPQASVLAEALARRLTAPGSAGGSLLLADYGAADAPGDTLRGFRQHALCEPLARPGSADLTADVDFGLVERALRRGAPSDALQVCGPVTQAHFLNGMGAGARLQALLMGSGARDPAARRALLAGAKKLLDPAEGMSLRFQFLTGFTTRGRETEERAPAAFGVPTPSQ